MNQIIFTTYSKSCTLDNSEEVYSSIKKYNKKKRFFKVQFSFFIIVSISLVINYLLFKNSLVKNERISQSISQSYRYYQNL